MRAMKSMGNYFKGLPKVIVYKLCCIIHTVVAKLKLNYKVYRICNLMRKISNNRRIIQVIFGLFNKSSVQIEYRFIHIKRSTWMECDVVANWKPGYGYTTAGVNKAKPLLLLSRHKTPSSMGGWIKYMWLVA